MKIGIIAGETSGDILAAGLIKELKLLHPDNIEFYGIGGNMMANEGFNSSFDMSILSIGGYGLDVLSAIPKILMIRHKIIKLFIEQKIDVFIGVDAPDFNLYIEVKLKQLGIKTIHYVSPTIWAWRYNRIFKIKKATNLVLCVFPMEEPLYAKEHIPAKFVGHHLADKIDLVIDTDKYKQQLQVTGTVFTILVGSRTSEIESLGLIFINACKIINQSVNAATFIFPFASAKLQNKFIDILNKQNVKFNYKVLLNQTTNAICASDLVLAKSGTVTLEVALCKKPMLISYKISKFTEWILRKRVKIKLVGLPNILLNEEVAPELIQDNATPTILATEFIKLYNNKDRQKSMINKFAQLHHMLRQNSNLVAAQAVLNLIK